MQRNSEFAQRGYNAMLPIVWASLVAGSECVVRVQDNVAAEVVQGSHECR